MAENQTASEDSGQQQQQQQQQQDQQQSNQQSTQPDSSPEQESSSDSITPNPRSKTMNMRNSLTSIKVPRAMSSTSSAADGDHQSHGSGKHHHNHHHHLHNNAGHHSHRVIHRTTSESLRLGSEYPGSSSMTNSTSNSSSIHGGGGSSSLVTTTPTNNSNSTTSNHSHSMSSSSSHTHSSHPHPHPHSHSHSNSGGGPMQRKPKTSSFQITSVTVGNKLSSDNGDDSADDLDESHTDDNSRITDLENETPSVSEDTFSKEDVFFANNALSTTAPVIPTSAQYGLVVVDPIGPSVGQTIQNVQVNVADNIINVVSAVGNKNKKPEVKETQHRSERFKVVKIESTEPFRRGRWMCMDYLDHSGNQVLNKEITPEKTISGSTVSGISVATTGDDTSRGTTQTAIIVTNDTSANVGGGGVENNIDAAAKLTADGNLNIYRSESQTSAGTGQNTNQTITHGQTLGGPINLQQQQQPQQPPQQQQQQLPNQFQGQQFEGGHGQTVPLTDFQQQPQHQVNGSEPSVAGQSQPASFFVTQLSAPAGSGGGGSTPTTFQQQPQAQQSTPAHGVTLPANILMQNGGGGSGEGNSTSFQPISFTPPSVAPVAADIGGGGATASSGQQPQQTSQVYATQPAANVAPQSYPSAANIIGGATYTTNAPASVNDTLQGTQQQSESNAGTPSSGGGSGQSQQQPPPSQQPPQFQTMHSNPAAGQTMPILNQMTYDSQSQQQQQQPSQTATNTPATISDPTAIAATIQQQQIDNNNFTTNNSNSIIINNNSNNNNNNSAASSSSTTAESSTAITSGTATGTSNNISQPQQAPSSSSSLSVAGSIQGSSGGSAAAPSTTGSTDDHQLHHNPETETESCASSLALALANRRKRNSSIPQLPILAPIFNFNDPTDPLNNTTSTATDEDITGTQNIFTRLALGDERYKLPATSDEDISSLDEYSVMRSLPIPIRAGTLGVGKHMNYDVMAYSASPTNSAYPYSPFYNGSPSPPDTVQQPLSISYDPSYGSNRLYVPTLLSQGHHRNYGDNNRLIRVIDVSGRCGVNGNGETSSATAAALAGGGGVASVLKSASGTSAVAIDNKIEQAMDLVKSHLMIAVREEVEVLKEKISELMDKINQLEVENTILKSNMSQETLHQLQLQAQLQIAGNGTANLIAAAQQPTQQQTQSQQPTAQPSQTPSSQQPNQQSQQQAAPQANPANTTNGPMS